MSEKKYVRFQTEEELLKSVLRSLPYDSYPKVSAIGGKKITPDIDILEIRKVSQNQFRLIGYELKLMKFDNRSKALSWNSFYCGIGQALLYLKNGVHRTFLILGFHKNVPDDKLIDQFRDWLYEKKDLLKTIIGDHLGIDLYLYEGGTISPIINANYDFYSSGDEIRLLSQELLQRKFTFDKRLKKVE
ncbi:MAG: hypothetical protein DRN49_00870 [Thaumarchaeota archaeon]|nr:MAG: hypothetical protein DRN49_00870 [Nitrososphaerota archaeon]